MPSDPVATAKAFLVRFRDIKRRLFADERAGKRDRRGVVDSLRRRYDRDTTEYLRVEGTTYAAWLEHGPRDEWIEVLVASDADHVWDRLVATYETRLHVV